MTHRKSSTMNTTQLNNSRVQSRNTYLVLRSIADHIYSKCGHSSFTVAIVRCCDVIRIEVVPDVSVYPNKYHRTAGHLQRVQDHVVLNHFPDLISSIDALGHVTLLPQLVPGVYTYTESISKKHRKWTRIQ